MIARQVKFDRTAQGSKNYKTEEMLVKKVDEFCSKHCAYKEVRYVIMRTEDGLYYPLFFRTDEFAVDFARHGWPVIS